jgi:hypothetical protein
MPQTFRIPLLAANQRLLSFPDCCACCGARKHAESKLALNRLVMRGQRQVPISVNYPIPHCQSCAQSTKAVFLAGCIPFALGFLLIGGAAFVWVALGASYFGLDNYGQPTNANSLVVGAAAGLFAGLVGGFLFEVGARVLLLPIFGKALLQAPLLATQLIQDSDYVAGVRGTLDKTATHLHLTFLNDTIAQEFQTLNAALLGRADAEA